MQWKWIRKVKDLYSWYSFWTGIPRIPGISLILSPIIALVVGVVGAVIKGVPWPITVMAGFCTAIAGAYLVALPIFIRAETRSQAAPPNIADEPIRPHWDAWKHYEKFTVHQAACLLENLEPSTHPGDPKVEARMGALCAAIRTRDLDFIKGKAGAIFPANMTDTAIRLQRQEANWATEISKAALMDFAKRNDIDLKYLGR